MFNNILSEKFSKSLLWTGLIILFIAIFLFLWQDNNFSFNSKIQSDKIGQFGDFIGGLIGSIWALAGVILFYIALKEQRSDFTTNKKVLNTQVHALNKQIEEFELQRKELEYTREVFTQQRDTLKLQQFESTYFSMVNLHHEIVNSFNVEENSISISHGRAPFEEKNTYKGRFAFSFLLDEITNELKNEELYKYSGKDLVDLAYQTFYKKYQDNLGHYFRNLYNILKFIDKKNPGDRFFYSNLLRAQLSSNELQLLFFNCISNYGKKFKPLIEKYHFLQNIPKSRTIIQPYKQLYNSSAFGRPK